MPFWSMVVLMVKWSIAAIPVSNHWCNGCKCIKRSCWWVPTFYLGHRRGII